MAWAPCALGAGYAASVRDGTQIGASEPREHRLSFEDHFSRAPADYRAFRPTYPDELFEHVASLCTEHRRALECGAGSGQATAGLVRHFETVVATDASHAQLGTAPAGGAPRVVCVAEALPLPDASVDLVAVAQALHWLRLDAFFAEVRRVARPGAVLAAWTYGLPEVAPEVDALVRAFAYEEVERFWPPGRRHVETRYSEVSFPFEELDGPPFETARRMTGEQFLGYVGTWSAVKRAAAATGEDPVAGLRRDFGAPWGPPERVRLVRWPLTLRAGRVR